MAKRRQDFSSAQGDLFQRLEEAQVAPPAPVDLDIQQELLGAIAQCLREARARGLSRERIVDRMNRLLPEARPVTLRQLNAWTAQSKEFSEFPARYLPALCAAVESDLPLRVLANAITRDLVDSRDQMALRLGQLNIHRAQLTREERELRQRLGGRD